MAMVAIGGMTAERGAQATARTDVPQLVMRIYDSAGLSPTQIEAARKIARGAFNRAGLDVAWLDCSQTASAAPDTPCVRPVRPAEIIVRIVRTTSKRTDRVLGYTDLCDHADGVLATVFADEVDETARRSRVETGMLIGRVIVHEISHLLVGTSRHSPIGVMRGTWSDQEIRRNLLPDWSLSRRDAQQVRLGLLARAGPVPSPQPSPTSE
jgi:hypothetical protein